MKVLTKIQQSCCNCYCNFPLTFCSLYKVLVFTSVCSRYITSSEICILLAKWGHFGLSSVGVYENPTKLKTHGCVREFTVNGSQSSCRSQHWVHIRTAFKKVWYHIRELQGNTQSWDAGCQKTLRFSFNRISLFVFAAQEMVNTCI